MTDRQPTPGVHENIASEIQTSTPTPRRTFEVPEGYEAVRDSDGRATGEVRPTTPAPVPHVRGPLRILQEGIKEAEADIAFDADAGNRSDVSQYGVSLPYETAREMADLLRTAVPRGDDDIIDAMVLSLRKPFPSESLTRSGGIDYWREIMRAALRAALAAEGQNDG